MKIVFVTTQSLLQSTLIGRVLPIAQELAKKHEITLLVHEEYESRVLQQQHAANIQIISVGKNPFTRTSGGKKRFRGFSLMLHMLTNAIRSCRRLIEANADCIVIVKPLPENVFAVWLARFFMKKTRIVLDVDDFELLANKLTSFLDRAAIHASERVACWMADACIVATPFLEDHIRAIYSTDTKITLIPTGYSYTAEVVVPSSSPTLLYIGSVSNSSGHHVAMLPDILARVREVLPNATLIIAGSGDDEERLKHEFRGRNLEKYVEWFGRFSDSDIPNLISRTAVILDPIDASIVSRAKSSFRVMLACATGLPVVTSNIGIRPLIIPSQLHSLFFAQADDSASYAEKATALLKAPLSSSDRDLLLHASDTYTHDRLAESYYSVCI